MPTGSIKKLVHLSQQTHLRNASFFPDHNDKGYGLIADEQGREVYFRHDIVEGRYGFDALRKGQQVEYVLEPAIYPRAASVKPVTQAPRNVQTSRPAA
jgi:cold shock CspA family protein